MRSSLIFLVSVVTSTRSLRSTRVRISFIRSSIWLRVSRTSTSGSTIPVGRTICSTMCLECSRSYSPGVADTNTSCGVIERNSANVCGRLSIALGSRNP